MSTNNNPRRTRRISQATSRGGRIGGRLDSRGRGRGGAGRGFARGSGRYGGRQAGRYGRGTSNYKRNRNGRMVQTTDGSHIEVIPGQSFSPEDWSRLPQAEKARIIEERAQY